METIDWDTNFDPAYGIVHMDPSKYIYYRGYDSSYPVISDRPAYFGSLVVAEGYAKGPGRKVDAFTNTKMLRLIDVRYMSDILRNLFKEHHDKTEDGILSTVLSFGICSLSHQIYLASLRLQSLKDNPCMKSLRQSYKQGLFEQQGVRIAETTNDAETMGFLQTLFSGFIDGFISPRQFSPFHVEKPYNMMHAEMIIFNPKESGITRMASVPPKLGKTSVLWFYNKNFGRKIHIGEPLFPYNFYLKSGGGTEMDSLTDRIDEELPSVEQINMRFDEPGIQDAWNRGAEAGELWKTYAQFGELINPVPTLPVRSWSEIKSSLSRNRKTRRNRH
jgi:hypothetical protein